MLVARREDRLRALAEELGGEWEVCDVADREAVERAAAIVQRHHPRIQLLVNNAGIAGRSAPIWELSVEEWRQVVDIDLTGVFLGCKRALTEMLPRSRGRIINMASVAGLGGTGGGAAYIAAKHGVVGLTRTAALEYVKHGIRVNAVNPGLIDTQVARDVVSGDEQAYAEIAKQVPIGRAGRPEEIAAAVLWLCSPGASYVVGQAITVDGEMTVP